MDGLGAQREITMQFSADKLMKLGTKLITFISINTFCKVIENFP